MVPGPAPWYRWLRLRLFRWRIVMRPMPSTSNDEPAAGIAPLPWYESTLLWGAAGAVITLVSAYVGFATKEIRWFLGASWPFCGLIFFIISKQLSRRWPVRIAIITVGSLFSALLLTVLCWKLPPPQDADPGTQFRQALGELKNSLHTVPPSEQGSREAIHQKAPPFPQPSVAPPCIPGKARVGTGLDAYKDFCDEELGRMIVDEAEKVLNLANRRIQTRSEDDRIAHDARGADMMFFQDYERCCESDVNILRTEALTRLGVLGKSVEEGHSWDSLQSALQPYNAPIYSSASDEVKRYSAHLRSMGLMLEQREDQDPLRYLLSSRRNQFPQIPNGPRGVSRSGR